MFDFLSSAEWWINTIMITIAAVTVVILIIKAVCTFWDLYTDISVHDAQTAHYKERLSMEHDALSKEHAAITAGLQDIQEALQGINKQLNMNDVRGQRQLELLSNNQKALEEILRAENRLLKQEME